MKILLLHQYFKTPLQGGGIRSYHITKALARAGHDVKVVTAHDQAESIEHVKGTEVHYLQVPYANHFSLVRRLFAFWSYYIKALKRIDELDRADLVYAISTPLSVGWLGKKVSEKWRVKLVFEVGDLWPEVPIQMGVVKNPLLLKWLYKAEKSIYESANNIIALSPDIADYIKKKTERPVTVVPNMSDIDFFEHTKSNVQDPFVIGYLGTIGVANHLEYLLDVAQSAEEQEMSVQFLIMGEGGRLPAIQEQIKKRGLKSIAVKKKSDMKGVRDAINSCQAIFLSFQDISILHSGSPNKLFDGLAAGKIIISNLTGWTKKIIEESETGICYRPDEPEDACQRIRQLLDNPDMVYQMQENARKLAEEHYSVEKLTNKVLKLIN